MEAAGATGLLFKGRMAWGTGQSGGKRGGCGFPTAVSVLDMSSRREKALTCGPVVSATPRCGAGPLVSWASEVSEAERVFELQRGGGPKARESERERKKFLFFFLNTFSNQKFKSNLNSFAVLIKPKHHKNK